MSYFVLKSSIFMSLYNTGENLVHQEYSIYMSYFASKTGIFLSLYDTEQTMVHQKNTTVS
jgi:hypothetical protein